MKTKALFIVALCCCFGCKHQMTKPQSPANGTYLMSVHYKYAPAMADNNRAVDTTYPYTLTISGTMDSIRLSFTDEVYCLSGNSEDTLRYYQPWPPPGAGYYGHLSYSKQTKKVYLVTGFTSNSVHTGSSESVFTQQ